MQNPPSFMAKHRIPEQTWFASAARSMVRNGISLRQAAGELDIPLSLEEADKISKQKAWQDTLWAERHKFNTELANQPGATQTSLVGLSYILIQELIKEGSFDKALDGIQKLARLRGWDKANEINIFAGITSADIEAQRKQIEKEISEQLPGSTSTSKPN